MRNTDVDALLALADDFELCNGVFKRFADFRKQIDVDTYSEEERVVTLAWHSSGIIGNGGFEYLFEGSLTGDPGYIRTAAAFETIGAAESYAAFQRALGVFGGRYPDDPAERDAAYHRVPEEERTAISRQFWDDDQNMTAALARYIRERRTRFGELLSHPHPTCETFSDDNRNAQPVAPGNAGIAGSFHFHDFGRARLRRTFGHRMRRRFLYTVGFAAMVAPMAAVAVHLRAHPVGLFDSRPIIGYHDAGDVLRLSNGQVDWVTCHGATRMGVYYRSNETWIWRVGGRDWALSPGIAVLTCREVAAPTNVFVLGRRFRLPGKDHEDPD